MNQAMAAPSSSRELVISTHRRKKKKNYFTLFKKIFNKTQDDADIETRKFQLELLYVVVKTSHSPLCQEWLPKEAGEDRWEAILASNHSLARSYRKILKSDSQWAQRLASLVDFDDSEDSAEPESGESEGDETAGDDRSDEEREKHAKDECRNKNEGEKLEVDEGKGKGKCCDNDKVKEEWSTASLLTSTNANRSGEYPSDYQLEGVAVRRDRPRETLVAADYVVSLINSHPDVRRQQKSVSISHVDKLFGGHYTQRMDSLLRELLYENDIDPPHDDALKTISDAVVQRTLTRPLQSKPDSAGMAFSGKTSHFSGKEISDGGYVVINDDESRGEHVRTLPHSTLMAKEAPQKAKRRRLDGPRIHDR